MVAQSTEVALLGNFCLQDDDYDEEEHEISGRQAEISNQVALLISITSKTRYFV